MSRRTNLIEFFRNRPDSVYNVDELTAEFTWDKKVVQQEMANILRRNDLPGLVFVVKANSWKYSEYLARPAKKTPVTEATTAEEQAAKRETFRKYTPKKAATKKRPTKKATAKKPLQGAVAAPIAVAAPVTTIREIGTTRKGELVLEDMGNGEIILGRRTGWILQ